MRDPVRSVLLLSDEVPSEALLVFFFFRGSTSHLARLNLRPHLSPAHPASSFRHLRPDKNGLGRVDLLKDCPPHLLSIVVMTLAGDVV
jgi:hypothetical protein